MLDTDLLVSNKQILTNLVERKIGNLLDSSTPMISTVCDRLIPHMPMIKNMAIDYVDDFKKKKLNDIQQWSDLLVETSFIKPDISLEEAISNAENIINEFISGKISEQTGLPEGIIRISLPALFGVDLLKL